MRAESGSDSGGGGRGDGSGSRDGETSDITPSSAFFTSSQLNATWLSSPRVQEQLEQTCEWRPRGEHTNDHTAARAGRGVCAAWLSRYAPRLGELEWWRRVMEGGREAPLCVAMTNAALWGKKPSGGRRSG